MRFVVKLIPTSPLVSPRWLIADADGSLIDFGAREMAFAFPTAGEAEVEANRWADLLKPVFHSVVEATTDDR
jgi:hypothetical protein